jgi:predicted peptidase
VTLLLLRGRLTRGPRQVVVDSPPDPPALNPIARFVVRSIIVPADATLGTDAATLDYQQYIPADAALTARGWLGQPYRVIVAMHSSAEQGTNNTNQMTGAGLLPKFLGYGSSVSQTYPFFGIFPQKPATYTGPASGQGLSGGAIAFRLMYKAIPLMMAAAVSEFVANASKVCLTGVSQGGFWAFGMTYQNPSMFKAFIPCASSATTAVNTVPGVNVADNPAAANLVVPAIKNIPTRMYNSLGDTQTLPSIYQPTVDKYNTLSPFDFTEVEYASGDHGTVWTRAYQDAALWSWLSGVLA